MLPMKFQVNCPFSVQEKKRKIEVQDGSHGHFGLEKEAKTTLLRWRPWQISWIFDRNDFNHLYLQVTSMLPIKFQVSLRFGSEEEPKNRFSR